MNHFRSFSVLGLVAVAAASFAQNGTSNDPDTCFTGATGTVGNISIPNRFEVRWGYKGKNILQFIPTTFTITGLNQPFKIGSLNWFNSSSKDTNGNMLTNLQIGLDLGSRGSGLADMDLRYQESKSTSGRNDKFTLPTAFNAGSVLIDGRTYGLQLTGFRHNRGAGEINGNTWANKEMQWDKIDVYAAVCPPVPEPATMAALGLGVLALVRRKRK